MEISNKREVEKIIADECAAVGLTDRKPFERLAKLIDAKKITVDKYGEEHIEDDNASQLKAVEMVLRLKRLLDNKVEDVKAANVTIQVSANDINRLESITKELKELEGRLSEDKNQRGKIIEVVDAVIA